MSQEIATREISMRDSLRAGKSGWVSLWNECAAFCAPDRKMPSMPGTAALPSPSSVENTVAKDALVVMAGGCKMWVTPGPESGWGQWQPPMGIAKPRFKRWLADCTQRADYYLSASGFYDESHEMYGDLGVCGVAGFSMLAGENKPLRAEALHPATYEFDLGWDGDVTRVILTYVKPASAWMAKFGDACPEMVKKDVAANKGHQPHEIVFSIYKRPESEKKPGGYLEDPEGMEFASAWICPKEKRVIQAGGFDEMPFVSPRWGKWSWEKKYGISPAMMALAGMRGVNVQEMVLATLGELSVNPRILRQTSETGPIDLSPAGVSQVSSLDSQKEWATAGRYDVGVNLLDRKEESIRRAFYANLFEQLAPIERQMTMYEVQARQQEAISRIAPAMGRLSTEFIEPVMKRVFMMLYRGGYFEPAPEEAFEVTRGGRRLLVPSLLQTNRMARALNNKKAVAFQAMLNRRLPVAAAGRPEVLDDINFFQVFQDLDLGDGVDTKWLLSKEELDTLNAAKAQAAQMAAAQEALLGAAKSKPMEVATLAQGMLGGGM